MFLHAATHFAIVRHILSGLYITVHCIFVSSCIRISALGINDIKSWKNMPWHLMCFTLLLKEILLDQYTVTDVCIHNPENIKNWECKTEKAHYYMGFLSHQYWLNFLKCIIQNFNILRLFILWWNWGWLAAEACVGYIIFCF